ncbi:hypothetical protein F511_11868 [Dorcoceras hygrometricum]|uniref:Uncharacterized protein n=1 Tax=Dorcoceras hygrometricum TaxID=472368 RepID=A0A2Z7C771_9LAMI|nr:hypothetical protein F511_11868 [Dorcoceras hygrometricum]
MRAGPDRGQPDRPMQRSERMSVLNVVSQAELTIEGLVDHHKLVRVRNLRPGSVS